MALVKVAEETLKNDTLHLEQVQAMVKVGQKTAIDFAQVGSATGLLRELVLLNGRTFKADPASLTWDRPL